MMWRVAAAALAAGMAAAVAAGQEAQVLARPETGPVAVSILNEMHQAYRRAEVWLAANEGEATESEPVAAAESPEALYWVLAGEAEGDGGDLFEAAAALALALDAGGAELVFLSDGEPVEWRKAVIHALVSRQRVDPVTGGGYWAASRSAPAAEKRRATRLALEALSVASGEAF